MSRAKIGLVDALAHLQGGGTVSIYDLATDQAVIYTLGNAPSGSPVILQWPDRATLEVRLGMNPNHVNFACVFEVIEQMPSNILPIQGITS